MLLKLKACSYTVSNKQDFRDFHKLPIQYYIKFFLIVYRFYYFCLITCTLSCMHIAQTSLYNVNFNKSHKHWQIDVQ